jgi:hypothetical protein
MNDNDVTPSGSGHPPIDEAVRVVNGWWCDEHEEIHMGQLGSWTMEHRASLHPLYVHRRTRG